MSIEEGNVSRLAQFWTRLVAVAMLLLLTGCASLPNQGPAYFFKPGPQRDLLVAAGRGNVTKMQKLLDQGANINEQGRDGMSALMWALCKSNKRGYEWLLKHGASPNLQLGRNHLAQYAFLSGVSTVSLAAKYKDVWFLETALKHGGDPNILNNINKNTPIYECMFFYNKNDDRLKHVEFLIKYGADLNFISMIETPMMAAARFLRYDMVYILLEAGADPTIIVKGRWSSLLEQMRVSNVNPKTPMFEWRKKVIGLLRQKGIPFDGEE